MRLVCARVASQNGGARKACPAPSTTPVPQTLFRLLALPPSPPPGCDTITANKERSVSCIGFIAGLLSLRATPLVELNEEIAHKNCANQHYGPFRWAGWGSSV